MTQFVAILQAVGNYPWFANYEGPEFEVLEGKGLDKPIKFMVIRGNDPPRELGHFTLAPLPGCCGVVVSTESYLDPSWRGKTVISEHFHKIKEATARKLGYSMMLATVQLRNIPEVVGGSKAGWKLDHFFRNKRTENDLAFMFKELK